MLLSCSFRIGRTHNQTGKMNKLLSLLLLAFAVVSTQGFAVSSGIPVMGGAVGGTFFFRCAGFSWWRYRWDLVPIFVTVR